MLKDLQNKVSIYNTLNNRKEKFVPLKAGKIKMYVCGPTVYDFIHIGNARPMITFDVFRHYMESIGFDVCFMQNFTDVDDKLIKRAAAENCRMLDIAERFIKEYEIDSKALNVEKADICPRATETMPEIVKMVKDLVDKGYAYVGKEGVYFRVRALKNYGRLSGHNLDELIEGQRELVHDTGSDKEDSFDFAIWKFQKPGEPAWPSPYGAGRPGWHIECSAMIHAHLGEQIDIHCGGQDLIFPHHENEMAQSYAYTGKTLANYWMHNAYINVDNVKMSKSLGNFWTIRELAKKFDYRVIRYFMLSAHYRSPINFSLEVMQAAEKSLQRVDETLQDYLFRFKQQEAVALWTEADLLQKLDSLTWEAPEEEPDFKTVNYDSALLEQAIAHSQRIFMTALADDLNTALAMSEIFNLMYYCNLYLDNVTKVDYNLLAEVIATILFYEKILGISAKEIKEELPAEALTLLEQRQEARKTKNYALADEIRNQLQSMGYTVKDTPQGPQLLKL